VRHPVIELRIVLEQLQALGQFPFGRQLAAVAVDPRLSARVRQRIDPMPIMSSAPTPLPASALGTAVWITSM
jgi:hypothetical protein